MSSEQSSEMLARQAGRQMWQLQSNMPSFVELSIFLIIAAISVGFAIYTGQTRPGFGISIGVAGVIAAGPPRAGPFYEQSARERFS